MVPLQQQNGQILQALECAGAEAADVVVGQPQLPEPGRQARRHGGQPVVVGEEVAQLRVVLQHQQLPLQLVLVHNEPAEIRGLGQHRGGQAANVVPLGGGLKGEGHDVNMVQDD